MSSLVSNAPVLESSSMDVPEGQESATESGMTQQESEEDKQKAEEYKIWRKNTPFLYDLVLTHSLDWPSLTVEWLSRKPKIDRKNGIEEHKVLLGTNTSGEEPNYVMIADVKLPMQDIKPDSKKYNSELKEIGGYSGTVSKVEIKIRMTHDGEVNRARCNPHNDFLIATKSPLSTVFVFDYSKHPSTPSANAEPNFHLLGHTKEGYGLSWNPHPSKAGYLMSGSDDAKICIWDINEGGSHLQANYIVHEAHGNNVVEDVDWHRGSPFMFGSVGDDHGLALYDMRESGKTVASVANAHNDDVNCLAFNPKNEWLLATGGNDSMVNIWDMRNLKNKFHSCEKHQEGSGVYQVEWNPHNEFVLASSSSDRRMCVWDLSRIGEEQKPQDAADGPPELLFVHGGHTSKVSDFSWNLHRPWTMTSIDEDNITQIWQMSEQQYLREPEDPMDTIDDDDLEGI